MKCALVKVRNVKKNYKKHSLVVGSHPSLNFFGTLDLHRFVSTSVCLSMYKSAQKHHSCKGDFKMISLYIKDVLQQPDICSKGQGHYKLTSHSCALYQEVRLHKKNKQTEQTKQTNNNKNTCTTKNAHQQSAAKT